MKIRTALLSAVILALSFDVEARNKQIKNIKPEVSTNNPALINNQENTKSQEVFFPQQDIVRFTSLKSGRPVASGGVRTAVWSFSNS